MYTIGNVAAAVLLAIGPVAPTPAAASTPADDDVVAGALSAPDTGYLQ